MLANNPQTTPLIHARFIFILLQFSAIYLSQHGLNYDFPFAVLYIVVSCQLAVNMGYYLLYSKRPAIAAKWYFATLLSDILFLSIVLYYSGGAANPFVSLLLLPIAIACVTLPKTLLLITTLLSMLAYALLLFSLDPHALHHMDMEQHLFGMWLNFLLSALVVVVIVASLIRAVNRQENFIRQQREEQLRQEQLLSLGTAAAQFAHRLATPLATAHLLAEELHETAPDSDPLVNLIDEQLVVCRRHLDDFRDLAEQVKTNAKQQLAVNTLATTLAEEVQLNFPQAQVNWQLSDLTQKYVESSPILLPALLNLIQNAVNASKDNGDSKLNVNIHADHNQVIIAVRDFGPGFEQDKLRQLGVELIDSDKGLGMGVFLSHVSLERLGGRLKLFNHDQGGAVAEITLPLCQHKASHAQAVDLVQTEAPNAR